MISLEVAEELDFACWVAQRFAAAINALFSMSDSAAEVTLPREKHFFRSLLGANYITSAQLA
jgi:hypothetical protein